jgi:predicted transcriptional regulator
MTAEQIKAERRAKNLSQTELAKKAGVHLLTIFRAENGKVKPATIEKIVAALKENITENQ